MVLLGVVVGVLSGGFCSIWRLFVWKRLDLEEVQRFVRVLLPISWLRGQDRPWPPDVLCGRGLLW